MADTVVLATGAAPQNELAEALGAKGLTVELVGDAAGEANALAAIAGGYQAGCRL